MAADDSGLTEEEEMMTDPTATPDGQDTLVASWEGLAQLTPDARVVHTPTAVAAVFPSWAPLNNAILLDPPSRSGAATAAVLLKDLDDDANVTSWALWLPSRSTSFGSADRVVTVDGLTRDTTTLVMKMAMDGGPPRRAGVIRTSVAAATRACSTSWPSRGSAAHAPPPCRQPRWDRHCTNRWVSRRSGATRSGSPSKVEEHRLRSRAARDRLGNSLVARALRRSASDRFVRTR